MLRRIYNYFFGEKSIEITKHPSHIEHNDKTYFLYGGWSELFPIIGKGINITYKNVNGDNIFYSEKYTGKLMIDEKILQPIYWKYSPSIYECPCNQKPEVHPTLTSELQEKLLQEMRDVGALK
jgi:hypothetical protein